MLRRQPSVLVTPDVGPDGAAHETLRCKYNVAHLEAAKVQACKEMTLPWKCSRTICLAAILSVREARQSAVMMRFPGCVPGRRVWSLLCLLSGTEKVVASWPGGCFCLFPPPRYPSSLVTPGPVRLYAAQKSEEDLCSTCLSTCSLDTSLAGGAGCPVVDCIASTPTWPYAYGHRVGRRICLHSCGLPRNVEPPEWLGDVQRMTP